MARRRSHNGQDPQKQFENQVAGDQVSQMANPREEYRHGGMSRDEYLDRLTDHGLDDRTAELVENLLSPDFVLSKISGAEAVEMKWLVRLQAEKIKAMHPDDGSPLQGKHRAVMYDDPKAALKPLSDFQKSLLEQAIWDIFFRVKRSEGGWQQQELSSQYNVSRVDSGDDGDSEGRLNGLF